MPTDKPRVMLTLDPDTHALFQKLADEAGLSVSGVIGRFLGAHMHEAAEYLEWIEKQKKATSKHALGKNLMVSYGPDDLIEGIRRLDPKHKFIYERFNDSIKQR
jgi:hypothetical protein